jgi:hypothetical protein
MPTTVKPVETEVQYMEDMDVEWISLVDKGANRTPFKIIKSEDAMEEVIQSVITPITKNFEEYKEKNDWSRELKILKTENHGEYNKFVSIPIDELNPSSIKIVRLKEDDDVFAVVGSPYKLEPSHIIYKSITMDKPIRFDETGIVTFRDTFFNEVSNLLSILSGTMELSELDNRKKKDIIGKSLDAFKSFISAGLDISSVPLTFAKQEQGSEVNMGDTINLDQAVETTVEKVETAVVEPQTVEHVFKSEEKILEMISVLTQKIEELTVKTEAVKAEPEIIVEKAEEAEKPEEVVKVEEVVKTEEVEKELPFAKFEETLDTIRVKLEKLEQAVEKIDADVPEPSIVQEPVVKEEPTAKNESPFSGIFGNLRKR